MKRKFPTSHNSSSSSSFSDAMNPFIGAFQLSKTWYRVGLTSEFPDIADGDDNGCQLTPSCKAFKIPSKVNQEALEANLSELPKDLKDQVLIFKYQGKIHAIDHVCSPFWPWEEDVADEELSNARILHSRFRRGTCLILRISVSS